MEFLVIIIFVLGYLIISCEHFFKIDKTIPALIIGALNWAIIAFFGFEVFEIENGLQSISEKLINNSYFINKIVNNGIKNIDFYIQKESVLEALSHHIKKISEILIFLIGAMTIVEIIDLHKGFLVIKKIIKTKNKKKILWIVCFLSFILSAIIDNLTATVVLITILRKLIINKKDRLWYVSAIIIAANSGGAWSPIGDVTTTMLWIAYKVTPIKLIEYVLIPSIISMVIPIYILQYNKVFKGFLAFDKEKNESIANSSIIMLYIGIGMIIMVPIFKMITNLPPYIGMIFSLATVWLIAEIINLENFKKRMQDLTELSPEEKFIQKKEFLNELKGISVHKALSRIEMSSILFFLGILLGVGSLESLGFLFNLSTFIKKFLTEDITIILVGIGSAIIDNVPLVAACLGMFNNSVDANLWHFIAFSAGTGGSMLIIGSAAGVAAMGMEKINFLWYLKNISWIAFIGFISGCFYFILFLH